MFDHAKLYGYRQEFSVPRVGEDGIKRFDGQDTVDFLLFKHTITRSQFQHALTWIERLRSGEFKQITGKLGMGRPDERGWVCKCCVLGVGNLPPDGSFDMGKPKDAWSGASLESTYGSLGLTTPCGSMVPIPKRVPKWFDYADPDHRFSVVSQIGNAIYTYNDSVKESPNRMSFVDFAQLIEDQLMLASKEGRVVEDGTA